MSIALKTILNFHQKFCNITFQILRKKQKNSQTSKNMNAVLDYFFVEILTNSDSIPSSLCIETYLQNKSLIKFLLFRSETHSSKRSAGGILHEMLLSSDTI